MLIIQHKKAIIFDLYETLTDYETNWSDVPRASVMLGVDSKAWNDQLLLHSADRLTGKLRDPFLIVKQLAHNIDSAIPDELIREAALSRTKRYADALRNIPPENVETIIKLRQQNKKIALLSNADMMECGGWENSPLAQLFDEVVFSCDAGFAKPDPNAYLYCMKKLGVVADDCLFVGDGGSNELVGAKNMGITSVFISGKIKHNQPQEVNTRLLQADYHIEHIPDLLQLQ
jgi:putative hydrolase of the HAD superfamily